MTNTQPQPGDLATQCIGADKYIVHIDKVTPKTITVRHTIHAGNGKYIPLTTSEPRTYRWSEKRQRYVYATHFTLALGIAVEHRDPSF